jgi:RNA polymerase sigma-70 factor (ECF subfamily)
VKISGDATGWTPTRGDPVLFERVYDELHKLARRERKASGRELTLNTTALVHEAYLKLRPYLGAETLDAAFFALASRAMRHILVDHARRRGTRKHGGDFTWTDLSDELPQTSRALVDVIALDSALNALEQLDPDQAALVELHVFSGLSMDDVAELRGISTRTVFREWRKARAFLIQRIMNGPTAA